MRHVPPAVFPAPTESPTMGESMRRLLCLNAICFLTAVAYGAQANSRFARKFQMPGSSEVVVVAEGDFEPRSVGSYALTVYGGRSKKFPTDDFVTGIVRSRKGTVENVRFEDVDGDGKRDIIVIIRSAGSGGFLSADAFRYRPGSLEAIATVANLDKNTDPVQALRAKMNSLSRKEGK